MKVFCSRSLVPNAMSHIVRDFYVEKSVQFDFIIYGKYTKFMMDVVSDVGKLTFDEKIPSKVIAVTEGAEDINIEQSAVLLFDTLKSYHDFHDRAVLINRYSKQFHFLVYILYFDKIQQEKMLTNKLTDQSDIFRFESIIMQNTDESLRLITFVTFQQPTCHAWTETQVNHFSVITKKWKSREFFLEKYKNYNGCELVIMFAYPSHPAFDVRLDDMENVVEIVGYGTVFLREIGKHLNYTIQYNFFNQFTGTYYNASIKHDFMTFVHTLKSLTQSNIQVTWTFTTSEDIILISKSDAYTQFEKLFLPFDDGTWLWLIITLSMALLTILLVKLTSTKVQNFVFGTKVKTPILNLM